MNDEQAALINTLAIADIMFVIREVGGIDVPSTTRRSKAKLVEFARNCTSRVTQNALLKEATEKIQSKTGPRQKVWRKRKRGAEEILPNKTRRLEEPRRDIDRYLVLPSEDEIRQCYREFRNATSNEKVRRRICVSCAREADPLTESSPYRHVPWCTIPNRHRLRPTHPHPAHAPDLLETALIARPGLKMEDNVLYADICQSCWSALHGEKDLPPKFSLANDMWIGTAPSYMQSMSFAEQLLIAHIYPRVYAFKLFPKKGGMYNGVNLQRGMKGTVTSFAHDMRGVVDMLKGNLMPRPPSVLARVIAITYIGVGKLPRHCLHRLFKVRRPLVVKVLHWYTENNRKYYGDVSISPEHLNRLPEDDVPDEILDLVRYNDDVGVEDEEEGGYIPRPDEEDTGEYRQESSTRLTYLCDRYGRRFARTRCNTPGRVWIHRSRHDKH